MKWHLQATDNLIPASEMEKLSIFFSSVMKKQMFHFMMINTIKNSFNSWPLEIKIQTSSLN